VARFFEALRRGVAAFKADSGPHEYTSAGRPVRCPHCGHTQFIHGSALLNTKGRTFFNMDWADPSAATLICAECSRIEWYAQEPDRVEGPPHAAD
jgi:hypothetical protein